MAVENWAGSVLEPRIICCIKLGVVFEFLCHWLPRRLDVPPFIVCCPAFIDLRGGEWNRSHVLLLLPLFANYLTSFPTEDSHVAFFRGTQSFGSLSYLDGVCRRVVFLLQSGGCSAQRQPTRQ